MISIFGKEEFDPVNRVQDPAYVMKMAGLWIALSLFWIALNADRVISLRAAGKPVSGFRYVAVAFWFGILLLWLWNGWTTWKKRRADKG